MKLAKVTHIRRFCTGGALTAGMLSMALGSRALATPPASGDASSVVIAPQPTFEPAEPTLVPPAPEEDLIAVQAAQDPFPASPGADAVADEFGIEINPAPASAASVNGRFYDEVYRSIPFNYTEYLANPGYRHDATMEILFGTLRPTTIVRNHEPQVIVNEMPSPYQPYRFSHSERWQYRAPDFRLLDPGCCW